VRGYGHRKEEPVFSRSTGTAKSGRDTPPGISILRQSEARLFTEVMVAFIDEHRKVLGVEPIC